MAAPNCPTCGYEFIHPDAAYRCPASLKVSCGCRDHEPAASNERRQHGIGRHHYRAYSTADAAKAAAKITTGDSR